jgi:hypothetical protein
MKGVTIVAGISLFAALLPWSPSDMPSQIPSNPDVPTTELRSTFFPVVHTTTITHIFRTNNVHTTPFAFPTTHALELSLTLERRKLKLGKRKLSLTRKLRGSGVHSSKTSDNDDPDSCSSEDLIQDNIAVVQARRSERLKKGFHDNLQCLTSVSRGYLWPPSRRDRFFIDGKVVWKKVRTKVTSGKGNGGEENGMGENNGIGEDNNIENNNIVIGETNTIGENDNSNSNNKEATYFESMKGRLFGEKTGEQVADGDGEQAEEVYEEEVYEETNEKEVHLLHLYECKDKKLQAADADGWKRYLREVRECF